MSSTAHKTEEEYVEHFDKPDVLERKLDQLAEMVKNSKHFIAFTGAGVSTSAGIPDFRSGVNTVLPTGAGVWTTRAEVESAADKEKRTKELEAKRSGTTSTVKAIPTPTHMALVELQRRGVLSFLVSQNTDGLHRRSGIPPEALSELHGNSNLEYCKVCGKQYLRDARCRAAKLKVHEHATGRMCACGEPLYDTIINFGENLPEKALEDAFDHARKADLCLAMGSSLRVTPAADVPQLVGKRKKNLVIVNLQSTPLDPFAKLRINATCDTVMQGLMARLNYPVPEFRLVRHALVSSEIDGARVKVTIQGVDKDGTPFVLFPAASIAVIHSGKKVIEAASKSNHTDPFTFERQLPADTAKSLTEEKSECSLEVNVEFMGHYREPGLKLVIDGVKTGKKSTTLALTYNPFTGQWLDPEIVAPK